MREREREREKESEWERERKKENEWHFYTRWILEGNDLDKKKPHNSIRSMICTTNLNGFSLSLFSLSLSWKLTSKTQCIRRERKSYILSIIWWKEREWKGERGEQFGEKMEGIGLKKSWREKDWKRKGERERERERRLDFWTVFSQFLRVDNKLSLSRLDFSIGLYVSMKEKWQEK